MPTLDIKRNQSKKILEELLRDNTIATKTVPPTKKSTAEIIQDVIKSLQNPSKETTELIDQSDATQVQEQSPNPLDAYFNSNKPSASPNKISDTPGILLNQNSSGFQRYADAIRRNSNKELVLSENRTHNLCIIAADSAEVQTTLARLSYSKTDLKNAEEMLKALANQAVKENNISSSSLDVKFYNSASMTETQHYATVFGQPISKADLKAFYDNKNDTIWINLDKSTGSTQDIIATFANELSHYVDDIKDKEFTPARQKASTNHERKADNLLYEFMGEDTRSVDQIKTFRQQAFFLDLDDRNQAAGEVKEPQPKKTKKNCKIILGTINYNQQPKKLISAYKWQDSFFGTSKNTIPFEPLTEVNLLSNDSRKQILGSLDQTLNDFNLIDIALIAIAAVEPTPIGELLVTGRIVKIAAKLGYKKTNIIRHGQVYFKKGNKYISYDHTKHNGGFWKMFDRKLQRTGTYNKNLTKNIGK